MKRQWRIRRATQPHPDGQHRWDRAYQDLLRWTLEHEAGQRAWGLDPAPYRPHLSLLYSHLPEEGKPAIADGLGLALPVTIRVDAAEIWADFRDDVTRWRRVVRVPLAG